jgi:hypothetical protein
VEVTNQLSMKRLLSCSELLIYQMTASQLNRSEDLEASYSRS